MKIKYMLAGYSYFIEPDYTKYGEHTGALHGARLYNKHNQELGYWSATTMPIHIQVGILNAIRKWEIDHDYSETVITEELD